MVQTRTRSGRQIKRPELYQPEETVLEDDYAPKTTIPTLGRILIQKTSTILKTTAKTTTTRVV